MAENEQVAAVDREVYNAFPEAVLLIVCGVEGFHHHHETVATHQYVMTTFLFSVSEIA